jgi:hypothetical protein
MAKVIAVSVGVVMLGLAGWGIWLELGWWNIFSGSKGAAKPNVAFDGTLKIEESKFLPKLDAAKKEMRRRFDEAAMMRHWSRVAGWAGFICTALMTVVAGFYGTRSSAGQSPADAVQAVLQEQEKSRGLIRIVGALVAISTLPGLLAQRLDSEGGQYLTSARELNKVISNAVEKLYDPATSLSAAHKTLLELEQATEEHW